MKVIFSPAKKMVFPDDYAFETESPRFNEEADELFDILTNTDPDTLCEVLNCSRNIARPIFNALTARAHHMPVAQAPALLSYSGISYRTMAPNVFTDEEWSWVQDHLRILSAQYGILKPLDSIRLYRLDFSCRMPVNLYEFWGDKIARTLENEVVLNLASQEYSRLVTPFQPVITVRFLEECPNNTWKEKGVYSKIARGAMVRFMAANQVEDLEQIKSFQELGYRYAPEKSSDTVWAFTRLKEDIPA